ncbi:MAG TPA: energy transducer TonB [Bryobacteraceae bacterium]|nr:energy transducer TonB [Bryobacteraceae bacterium]
MKLLLLLCASSLTVLAQDWTPKRVVAITEYPPLAASGRIQGEVLITCFLAPDGSVTRAEVVSGHPMLRDQARQNALRWRFEKPSGQAGNDQVNLIYIYSLEDEFHDNDWQHTRFFVDLPATIHIVAPERVVDHVPQRR